MEDLRLSISMVVMFAKKWGEGQTEGPRASDTQRNTKAFSAFQSTWTMAGR